MTIKKEVVGILQTNCYILEDNNEVLVIDPGDDFSKIDSYRIISVPFSRYYFKLKWFYLVYTFR